jgi:signal transduction histidine kinase|tara:strand:- start:53 stop:568 length:516 start_codon:yes stop_codon:yes gene_type:complete
MAEINIGGVTFKGGKIFGVLIALSTAVGALYGGFEVYKRYLDMEQKINEFVAPDLSGFDKKIELSKAEMDKRLELIEQELDMIKTEMSMILEEVSLVASTAKELKDDLKADLRQMDGDIRHITEIVNDVEDRQKEDNRELLDEMKLLEESLDLKINKALNNPLSGMSAKSK